MTTEVQLTREQARDIFAMRHSLQEFPDGILVKMENFSLYGDVPQWNYSESILVNRLKVWRANYARELISLWPPATARVLNEILAYIDGLTFDPSFNRDGVELCKDIIELHRDGLPDAGRPAGDWIYELPPDLDDIYWIKARRHDYSAGTSPEGEQFIDCFLGSVDHERGVYEHGNLIDECEFIAYHKLPS